METFCQLLQSHINLWRNVVFGTKRKRVLSLFSPEPNWFCRDRIPFTGHPWGDFYNWPEKPFQPYWGSFGSVEIVREELRQPSLAKSTQFCAFLDQVDWKHIFLDYFKISFKCLSWLLLMKGILNKICFYLFMNLEEHRKFQHKCIPIFFKQY